MYKFMCNILVLGLSWVKFKKWDTMVTSHRYKFDLFYLEQNMNELMILEQFLT